MFILFKFHYLAKDGISELGTLEFPMLPRNQRVRTVLSTVEGQTSGQNNGIPEFRANAPLDDSFAEQLSVQVVFKASFSRTGDLEFEIPELG